MSSTQENPWIAGRRVSGDEYDRTYEERAASGQNVHGEADFVESLGRASVLDAGCGTGRVGRELARRGLDVVGVDLDEEMLATARKQAPDGDWRLGDLATIDLARLFDVVVMAGNVMVFLTPGSEQRVVSNMALHLVPGGMLVAGFQLTRGLTIRRYEELVAAPELEAAERWATWEREPWRPGGDYVVSVHRKPVRGTAG